MEDEAVTNDECRGRLLHGVDWAVHAGATEEVMQGVRRRILRRRRRRLIGAAGTMAGLSIAGIFWFTTVPNHPTPARMLPEGVQPPRSAVVVNAPEMRTLPDGSVVELRKGAEVSVEYSTDVRRVTLLRGEAYFKVEKNDHQPFIVAARGVETRAVGTAFAVQLGESTVEVLVTEGRVAVQKAEAASRQPESVDRTSQTRQTRETLATVEAGACVVVDTATLSADVATVADQDLRQRMAWRTPLLEFSRTPLSEVVAMINRQGGPSLILADDRLGEVRISGILRADNVETLLRLLAGEHGIEADTLGDGRIALRAKG